MRLITGMLATTLMCGCGQADGTRTVDPGRPSDTAEAMSPLRVGRHAPSVSGRVRRTLEAAAIRLSNLQADQIGDNARNGLDDDDPDDGGWDFTLASAATRHSTTASPSNTYGATALGPWAAVRAGDGTERSRTTLLGAGLGAQEHTDIVSPNDFVFLTLLGELVDDTGFSELARARYDAKLAAGGGARAVAERDRDARHLAGFDGLILYDLAWYSLGAAALDAAFPGAGYDADADTFASVAVAALTSSPPLFDVGDANEQFYVQGLSWSLVVLERDGSSPALVTRVRRLLRELQGADGAWGFNAKTPADDLQSTAHAVQALALTSGDSRRGRTEALRGARWITSKQGANGGWEYAAGSESTLVDGEAMLALYLSQLFPGPTELEPSEAVGQASQPLTAAVPSAVATALAAPAD